MADEDFRMFIREERLRSERVWREVLRELRELRQASREHSAEIRQLSAEIRDMRAETIAQRDGLFRLIDKINELGKGPGPATA